MSMLRKEREVPSNRLLVANVRFRREDFKAGVINVFKN